ncbi:hypothetical protein [Paenibacillus sp. IHBB 10380]|uniref:hypothetical protein n=1 Tax=Paenibacillus sp. IHBB 10380 TaxID=1566358 RepID=UPI000698CF82|nr:hypothetical protein [Paenibacillus sp. IHBB 10380]
MEYCYVEFKVKNEEKLNRLKLIFEVIKEDKNNEVQDTDGKWIKLFSDTELDEFWWPNEQEYEETRKNLGNVYIKVVSINDNKQEDWDIYSMFEAIKDGEYELIGIRKISNSTYRLEFNPFAYPFGGIDSIRKLISCIGHSVVAVDDGTGRLIFNMNGFFEYQMKKKPWWKFW